MSPSLRILILTVSLLLSGNQLWAMEEGQRLTLQEFIQEITQLEFALNLENEADIKRIYEAVPQRVFVRYSTGNATENELEVSLAWLKQAYLEIDSNHSQKDSAYHYLQQSLGAYVLEISELHELKLDTAGLEQRRKAILKDRIYEFKPKEKPADGPDLRGLSRIAKMIERNLNALIVFGILLVLGFFLYRLRNWVDFMRVDDESEWIKGGLLQADDPRTSAGLKEKGQEKLKSGEFNDAVRYFYLSFILELHESKLIRYHASRTNWEYYSLITPQLVPEAPAFHVTHLFDASHYGEKVINQAEFRGFYQDLQTCSGKIVRKEAHEQ